MNTGQSETRTTVRRTSWCASCGGVHSSDCREQKLSTEHKRGKDDRPSHLLVRTRVGVRICALPRAI